MKRFILAAIIMIAVPVAAGYVYDEPAGGGGGTPGGSNTEVQFNDSGAFNGSSQFIWNSAGGFASVTSNTDGGAVPLGSQCVITSDANPNSLNLRLKYGADGNTGSHTASVGTGFLFQLWEGGVVNPMGQIQFRTEGASDTRADMDFYTANGGVNQFTMRLDANHQLELTETPVGVDASATTGAFYVKSGDGLAYFRTGGVAGTEYPLTGGSEFSVAGVASDGTGKVVCVKASGDFGTCTDAPNGSGVCTCA